MFLNHRYFIRGRSFETRPLIYCTLNCRVLIITPILCKIWTTKKFLVKLWIINVFSPVFKACFVRTFNVTTEIAVVLSNLVLFLSRSLLVSRESWICAFAASCCCGRSTNYIFTLSIMLNTTCFTAKFVVFWLELKYRKIIC